MKRKRIDVSGKVVEVEESAPATGVVGAIEHTATGPLEIPPDALRERPAELLLVDRVRLWLAERHVAAARWIRKHVLLMPDVDKMQKAQLMIGQQHLGFANLVSDVRLRMDFYEREIPLLGRARAQFEAQQAIRQGKKERALAERQASKDGNGESPA